MVLPRPASFLLHPMVLVFQPQPSTAEEPEGVAELESAAEPEGAVELEGAMEPEGAGEAEGSAELGSAVETEHPVRIKELMQFVETESLALGVEEVSGNLSFFFISSMASSYVALAPTGGPRCCSELASPFQVHHPALLKQPVIEEAMWDMS